MSLPRSWNVPKRFHERLGERSGKQRAMFHDGHLLIILYLPPDDDCYRSEAVYFWRDDNGNWQSTERGHGFSALCDHVKRYEDILAGLEKQYDRANDAKDYFRILEKTAPLMRAVTKMTEALQSARDYVEDKGIITLRDNGLEISRGFELVYNDAKNGLDYAIAKKSEEQAENSQQLAKAGHKLNILATLFLPITAIASIFGMNLASGLENSPPLFFWGVVIGSVVLGVLIGLAINIGNGSVDKNPPKIKRSKKWGRID